MTIASFSPFKAIGAIVIGVIPLVVLPWLAILTPLGLRLGGDGQAYRDDWVVWFFAALSPALVLMIFSILRKFLFEQGRAVWITDGNLHYMPMFWRGSFKSFFDTIPLSDIGGFSVGYVTKHFKGILIETRAGGICRLPTHLLEEPRDVVLARLNKALAANR